MANTDKYFVRDDGDLPNVCGNCDKKTLLGPGVMVCSETDKTVAWNGMCPKYK